MSRTRLLPALLCCVAPIVGCSSDDAATRPDAPAADPAAASAAPAPATSKPSDAHSFARPEEARVTHTSLDLKVDFASRVLSGTARHALARAEGAKELVLDTRDLVIEDVTDEGGGPLDYTFGVADPLLGRPLIISLQKDTLGVIVKYKTAPEALALLWLAPELTSGKAHPYLFTQGQAILTRTWVPLQDSPGIRITYDATILVPGDLKAVMSAEHLTPEGVVEGEQRRFSFRMGKAIPPYLIALAVGDLAYRELGPRTGVWAEPTVVEAAATEFADVERMMSSVERLYGKYRWDRYEILVLPPSFPFGGMENPRLTFLSPTVIAGDKSLVSVVAHELAHSWSGNLVTNATWADFWLNEGFTTYIENRILEEIYGKDRAKLIESIGRRDLLEEIAELGDTHKMTALQQDLVGKDPDDAITSTPYDKGMAFLRMLENELGREAFDAFLKRYFDENAFQSMTTERFAERLRREMVKGDTELERRLAIDTWLYQPGIPPNLPVVESALLARIEGDAAKLAAGASLDELGDPAWGSLEWVLFMRSLPRTLDAAQVAALDKKLSASTTGNSEIRFEWLKLVVANRYEAGFGSLEDFLTRQGRRRLVRPLYEGLVGTDWGKPVARGIYDKAKAGYHPLTVETLDEMFAKAGA